MSEHVWAQENLAGYVADGLSAEERERFERHLPGCQGCERALAEWRGLDQSLENLFAGVRPAAGLENRVIARLRAAPMQRRIQWTKTLRWIGSAAAVLMLGCVGYAMNRLAQTGESPFQAFQRVREAAARTQVSNNLKQIALAPNPDPQVTYSADGRVAAGEGLAANYKYFTHGVIQHGQNFKPPDDARAWFDSDGEARRANTNGAIDSLADLKKTLLEGEADLKEGRDDFAKPRKQSESAKDKGDPAAAGLPGSTTYAPPVANPLGNGAGGMGGPVPKRGLAGGFQGGGGAPLDNTAGGFQGGGGGFGPGFGNGNAPPGSGFGKMGGGGSVQSSRETAASAKSGPSTSTVTGTGPSAQTPTPSPVIPGPDGLSMPAAIPGIMTPDKGGGWRMPGGPVPISSGGADPAKGLVPAAKEGVNYYRIPVNPGDSSAKATTESGKELGYFGDLERKAGDKLVTADDGDQSKAIRDLAGKQNLKLGSKDDKREEGAQVAQGKKPGESKPAEAPATQQPPAVEPKATQRKIIRTGDVEYEVEIFDAAVADVTRLISAIPGAFVATINSEKLPNGKVRGSVVVRMPPETLDKFLLDLRKDLAKTGELKNQRIGSQDITKQYYDVESRLRAARTMEERLIDIIKKGKGEIKELLAAEKELGVWRTKIEEMEGEIRYYNNQVGLSTLTITLYEKEIRAAAAMVISEHVSMRIEADDVEKSLQAALAAVTDAKGRVTKSDLKQHAAGQYEAVLQFEVAPAAAGPVKEKLKTLGIITHHDAQRLQTAEGGSLASGEIKSRTSDVRFNVSLYNVANIQPRESYVLHLATPDVPADYRKLRDEVTKLKGQVRKGNLDEQDKLNVSAQFDFDVPAAARDAMDKLLAGLGDVLLRTTSQAAPGETATDRKVGYRLTLRNLGNIQPRESYKLQLATEDVPADYRKLQDEVTKAKGLIRVQNLNEQDKLNTAAQLDFDVPIAERERFDTMLAALGDVLVRDTVRAAGNEVATERRAGYRLMLRSLVSVPARESYVLQIAAMDVPAEYRKVQDAIAEAKGHLRVIQLNEQDKLNISAQLEFDVPKAERGKIDKLLGELGETLVRNTVRVQPHEIASERKLSYRLALGSLNAVAPRESFVLQIATQDVAADYRKVQDTITEAKGQVRGLNLNEQDKLNTTAQIDFDVPSAERKKIEGVLGALGEITSRNTERVPPGQVATERKVGYRLTLRNVASVPPRESVTLQAVSADVPAAYRKLQDAVTQAGGQVRVGQLAEPDKTNVTAQFDFDIAVATRAEIDKVLAEVGEVYSRTTERVPPQQIATERKVGYRLTVRSAAAMPPRDTILLDIKVADVDETMAKLRAYVRDKSGTIVKAPVDHEASGRVTALLEFHVAEAVKDDVVFKMRTAGKVQVQKDAPNPQVPDTKLATAHFRVFLANYGPIVPSDEGLWPQIQTGLGFSFKFLSMSVMFIVIGLLTVLPWALLLWVAVKLVRRMRGKPAAVPGA